MFNFYATKIRKLINFKNCSNFIDIMYIIKQKYKKFYFYMINRILYILCNIYYYIFSTFKQKNSKQIKFSSIFRFIEMKIYMFFNRY